MPISSRFVVNSTIFLLLVGFLALLAIVGMTIWLGEKAQRYVDEAAQARESRISAVELRSALQSAESSQRGFLVGGNEIYLAPYGNARTQAQSQFQRLKAYSQNSTMKLSVLFSFVWRSGMRLQSFESTRTIRSIYLIKLLKT